MNDLAIQPTVDRDGPQIIYDLDFDEYRAINAINASGLKLLERSPAHFQQARLEPHAPTAAQALGTLVHLLVLEPERENEVAVAPECDRRTKAGKDAWAEFQAESADRLIVTAEQWDTARRMRDAVRANKNAMALLADGSPEVTLLHTLDGTPIKCRLDWLCTGRRGHRRPQDRQRCQ
ncbi:MAG: PD-(D/E)XK nuclease-like domain-containing protein [Chromatiales bacterium]|nr:PD-(D/E)XK nuclease-like domain-containing protein [Chromatiales bacterium]